ncbi:MAG: pyridoxamine kinase [Clostridia bacterium]|nr:pyridoxamine kinase [Clostridia bacterium]
MTQKRIAAIHDISGVGKCSLTVALPICSVAGLETAVIPTAVLSNHTGFCFSDYTFHDLTDEIAPIAAQWKKEGFEFDAFYTGYLGSIRQTQLVDEAIKLLKTEKTIVITDPAMADHGKLYKGFPESFPSSMLGLCKNADIIIPNITEACLLLGIPYSPAPYKKEFIEELLIRLHRECGAKVVLTGVTFDERKVGAATFDGENISFCFSDKVDYIFHGTGDVFASCFVAAFMNGRTLSAAAELAVNFTYGCIKDTLDSPDRREYGVCFEKRLASLGAALEG